MLNRFAKITLVATSFAPVLLTTAFVAYRKGQFIPVGLGCLVVAVLLTSVCLGIIHEARARLEQLTFSVDSLKTADQEVLGFVVTYLLPLIGADSLGVDSLVVVFITIIFSVVIWGTHSYHFNPVLGVFGFHFYEATSSGNITYILITRRDLRNTKHVNRVVQISEYMLLDATD